MPLQLNQKLRLPNGTEVKFHFRVDEDHALVETVAPIDGYVLADFNYYEGIALYIVPMADLMIVHEHDGRKVRVTRR